MDDHQRRPSAYVWAVAGGRLKKFHMSQLRHASEQERLVSEATTIASLPWTFTSLPKLMGMGTYDDETKPPRRHWGRLGKEKRRKEPRPLPPEEIPQVSSRVAKAPRLSEFESEEELIPDPESRPPKRERAHALRSLGATVCKTDPCLWRALCLKPVKPLEFLGFT